MEGVLAVEGYMSRSDRQKLGFAATAHFYRERIRAAPHARSFTRTHTHRGAGRPHMHGRAREDARGRERMRKDARTLVDENAEEMLALCASRTPWHGGEDAPARSTRRASIQDAGIRQEQDTWSSRRAHSDVGYGDVGCVAQ